MAWKNEREFDRALGIDTSLTDMDWSNRRQHPCQPTPLAVLDQAAMRLTAENHVVDCGCGTGRAVFYLAHGVKCRVTGVEIDSRRMACARENLLRCARKHPETAARIALEEGAAQEVCPPDADVYYFFNPFPAAVLRGVLKRIGRRGVRLFCYYPDDEWIEVLNRMGWRLEESVDLRGALGADERERLEIWTDVEE